MNIASRSIQIATVLTTACLLLGCASSLERAVKSGDLDKVREEIDKGGNVSGSFYTSYKYPMQIAIENNELEIAELLYKNGATVEAWYLDLAVRNGSVDMYEFIKSASETPSQQCSQMAQAGQSGNYLLFKHFFDSGTLDDEQCHINWMLLSVASSSLVEPTQLLLGNGADPNRLYFKSASAISNAANYGRFETVRELLASGAFHTYHVAGDESLDLVQPIEFAVENGHQDVVRLLMYAGAKMPVRRSGWDTFKEVATGVAAGALVVATIALAVEGVKYSNTPSDIAFVVRELAEQQTNSKTTFSTWKEFQSDSSLGSCVTDFDCFGVDNICLKRPGSREGVCVRQVPWDAQRSLLEQAGHRTDPMLEDGDYFDCPTGFYFDVIYRACVR